MIHNVRICAVLFSVVAVSLLGHQTNAQDGFTVMTPNELVAEGFYEGLNMNSREAFLEVLAPNWVVHPSSPWEGETIGFDAYFESLQGGLSGGSYEIVDMISQDDLVVVRGTITGLHDSPFLSVNPTGRQIEFGAIDIHRIEGGMIAESWHIEDYLGALTQMGVFPFSP